jgi:hypothetical protein
VTVYRVLVGLNYPGPKGEVRREPGDRADDIPPESADWLLEQGVIEPVRKRKG